jgi:hypothetical protein
VAWLAVVLIGLLLVTSRCVPHPVGSARTYDKYVGKALTTAEGVASDVATVHLAAEQATQGRAFSTFVASIASDAEESIGARQATFASVQPPDDAAGAVGDELGALLDRAATDVRAVRIAARQDDNPALRGLLPRLDADSHALDDFQAAHR